MTANPPAHVRLFYVDDSGAPETGWIIYSWIECAIVDWNEGLRCWLDLRKTLFADRRIPPSYQLHTTKFLNGRGNPSTDPTQNASKQIRRQVIEQALGTIGGTPVLGVGTAYRHTAARGKLYARERTRLYELLVARLDSRLTAAGELGIVFMDGNGSDGSYHAAHRALKLRHRRLIEDPQFLPAHKSQWVQMVDIVAYSAYQGLLRHPAKQFAWNWYNHYLAAMDVNGGLLAL